MPKDELMPSERVIEALASREPDRVPWIELEVEQIVFDKILENPHRSIDIPLGLYNRDVEEEKAFSRKVGKDSITSYAKVENVIAMGQALKEYGRYPIYAKAARDR